MEFVEFRYEDDNWASCIPLLGVEALGDFIWEKDCFGVAGLCDGRVVAVIAATCDGDMASITSLYVLPEYRRQRVATTLLSRLYWHLFSNTQVQVCAAQAVGLLQEDMIALEGALVQFGYEINGEDNRVLEFTLGQVVKSGKMPVGNVCAISQVSAIEEKTLGKTLHERGYFPDIELPSGISKDYSLCHFDKNKLVSALLVEELMAGTYRIAVLYGTEKNPAAILGLVYGLVAICKDTLAPATRFVVDTYSETTWKLIMQLTGQTAKESHVFLDVSLLL